jgi:Zincin-like metallopeptidase
VEDVPPNQPSPKSGQQGRLLLGVFHGVPTTKKSIFDLPSGRPDHIVLYQKNIEAVCSNEAEVGEQIRLIKRADANGNSLCVTHDLRPSPSGHSPGTGLRRRLVVSSFRGRDVFRNGWSPVWRPKHTLC